MYFIITVKILACLYNLFFVGPFKRPCTTYINQKVIMQLCRMGLLRLKKEALGSFLESHLPNLYAPVRTDCVRFQKIKDPNEICLDSQADIPVKGFFFKSSQVLMSYKGSKIKVAYERPGKRIFFGLRRCDLNAIYHQDFIFIGKYDDPYYKAQREDSVLIGYHCGTAPSKYCFCESMDLKDYYDLMFYDKGDHFLVDVGSEKGKALITQDFEEAGRDLLPEDKKIGTHRLEDKDISKLYNHPAWKEGADRCLSCAACTSLCPTCYCHEVKDDVKIDDLKNGDRIREWSSCMLKSFTRVAGDHVFREPRIDRFKHRIYHQLQYFKERYDVEMCVGCGRCITHCPTSIDFVDLINKMGKQKT
jgi:sulfhydrogenase subunit beta (sulfur reductase)